jgi:hypothetical protein
VKKIYKKLAYIISVLVFIPTLVLAHQPRIVETNITTVINPEISKAYYGQLNGKPDVYLIEENKPFDLYVNTLVPDMVGQKTDITAIILKDGIEIVKLDGQKFEWKKFYEPFGSDNYLMGPEYKVKTEPGKYEIRVSSTNNDSKYSLAIGEIEAFDFKEGINAITLIPILKKNFFNESPISFMVSPFGWGFILVLYIVSFIFGLLYRFILKRFSNNRNRILNKNIGSNDRIIRFILGIILLLLAILTTWNPILIFLSGLCIFESFFSWCALYASLGKSSCPIE